MADTKTPTPTATTAPATAPTTAPTTDAPVTTGNIADASRAFRERLERIATAPPTPTTATEAPVGDQPRKPNGQFAPKDGDAPDDDDTGDEESVEVAATADDGATADDAGQEPAVDEGDEGDAGTEGEDDDAGEGEPKVLVLKGEEQRGEEDIELDLSGLPPEAVERLELLQRNGLRRQEFNREMQKVRTLRSDLDAVETEIAVDATGFVLSRVPPARRADLAEALLLDQWEVLAPKIQELWEDPIARSQRLDRTKETVSGRRNDVVQAITAAQQASEVREAVEALIPERVADEDARDFFLTAISILQAKATSGESFTAQQVPALLAAHRRRFFGAGASDETPAAPVRPKLAVRTSSSGKPAPATDPKRSSTTRLTPDQVQDQIRRRQAAKSVASQGAGGAPVQRPAGKPTESVQEASRRLREQARLTRAG